jgi:hypothetical protein
MVDISNLFKKKSDKKVHIRKKIVKAIGSLVKRLKSFNRKINATSENIVKNL